jgi:hypothetical protein
MRRSSPSDTMRTFPSSDTLSKYNARSNRFSLEKYCYRFSPG